MLKVLGCIVQAHDPRLVSLAAAICVLGCFTAANLMARARAVPDRAGRWLLTASGVFGSSIWALHFVAMIAFLPGVPITYEAGLTGLSIVIAIAGTGAALAVWHGRPGGWGGVAAGGLLVGLAVAGMHYTGVAAMRLPGRVSADAGYVAASLLIGAVCGVVALHRARDLSRIPRRLEVAGWLALSICGLHFTGMTALGIELGHPAGSGGAVPGSVLLGGDLLAVIVGAVSLTILVASLVAALLGEHLSERTLRELGRMRLLSNLAQETMVIHDGVRVLEVNSAGSRLFGMEADAIIGRPLMDLFDEGSRPALHRRARCAPLERRPEEVEICTANGRRVAVEFSCQPLEFQGRPATAVALRDLSDRKRDEARIRHLANHDGLTDLPNRFLLDELLSRAVNAARLGEAQVAVLHLGLDRFRAVNGAFGHAAGDALLVEAAARLKGLLRGTDALARVGGDEFVAVLKRIGARERVSDVAERMIAAMARPFSVEGREIEVCASVGIAVYDADGTTPEALLHGAVTALARAKAEGRGGLRFFEASMDAALRRRRELENELRHAAGRGELRLAYQPVVSGRTGEVEGFEALVRWRHPKRGLVSPGEFIPLAEETGLILGIGQWVVEEACRAAAGWPRPWRVAVNLSPAQFGQPGLPAIVAGALAAAGLDASRLEIEITEGVLIEDARRAVEVLTGLRALGIRLALDDFGTGYSSLSYLRLFPFDKLKVDQSFVRVLGEGEEAATIVNTIINLGHNLRLAITAEGVETVEQLRTLQAQGCDLVQGYLLGRPEEGGPPSPAALEGVRALVLGGPGAAGAPLRAAG